MALFVIVLCYVSGLVYSVPGSDTFKQYSETVDRNVMRYWNYPALFNRTGFSAPTDGCVIGRTRKFTNHADSLQQGPMQISVPAFRGCLIDTLKILL